MRATWNDHIIAESDDVVTVEGNAYFPLDSVNKAYLQDSGTHSSCPWKGVASYYSLDVGGKVNRDAAWFYPDPKPAAAEIAGRIAFWKGVVVN